MLARLSRLWPGVAAAALVFLAPANAPAQAQAQAEANAQSAAEPTAAPSGRQVKSAGNAEWAITAEEARTRAAAQNKLVYYEFESNTCGPCVRMQSLLYPAFDFEALLIGMVPVKVQLGSGEGKELAERYAVGQSPSILITTPSGRLVFLMQGFKDTRDFYAHVHRSLDDYRVFARRIEGQDVPSLPAQEAFETGRQLFKRFDYEAARPRLKRATAAPDATPAIRDAARESLAACELELRQPVEARRTIEKLIATTKDPEAKERAELFRAQIPLSQSQPEEALSLYKKFERDHPHSKYLEQVRGFISRLQPADAPK